MISQRIRSLPLYQVTCNIKYRNGKTGIKVRPVQVQKKSLQGDQSQPAKTQAFLNRAYGPEAHRPETHGPEAHGPGPTFWLSGLLFCLAAGPVGPLSFGCLLCIQLLWLNRLIKEIRGTEWSKKKRLILNETTKKRSVQLRILWFSLTSFCC